VIGVGRRQWLCAEAGRRAAPPITLGRRTGVMMASGDGGAILISMLLPRARDMMDTDGTKLVAATVGARWLHVMMRTKNWMVWG
jgi:hypothetical protein